jgi:Tfp pilus assembly protein PilZ
MGKERACGSPRSDAIVASPVNPQPENVRGNGRRYPRIATPKGVWVAWQDGSQQGQQNVSRVRDLNVGGLLIATPNPLPLGTEITLLLSVPEGEIKCRAVVRNIVPNEGMGVQFRELREQDTARLQNLVTRLLASNVAS